MHKEKDSVCVPPPEPNYTKDLLKMYTGFVRWIVSSTGKTDILCRRWALNEREMGNLNYPTLVTSPSWIQMASPEEKTRRGAPSDSFVGLPGHRRYDASYGTKDNVSFANYSTMAALFASRKTEVEQAQETGPSDPSEAHESTNAYAQRVKIVDDLEELIPKRHKTDEGSQKSMPSEA